ACLVVDDLAIPQRYFSCLCSHRRINVDLHARCETTITHELTEETEQLLGAADRESRDNDVAALVRQRFAHHVRELVFRFRERLVAPVAVGGLDGERARPLYGG